jgi:hypothetical protein
MATHGSGQGNLKGKGWTATGAHQTCVAVAWVCLPDVEGRGIASEGDAGTGRRSGRRVERASRRWRAALCTAAAGGRNCSGGRSRAGEQEGSEEEDEREKRPRTHMQN